MQVLVLEDDPLLLIDAGEIVAEAGHEVMVLADTLDAAALACAERLPDAALLDFNLADGLDSAPLADRLLAARVPVAFATGQGRHFIPERFRHLPIIEKPYRPGEIRSFLDGL